MRLVTERMPWVRSVTFGVWVSIGSSDESPRILGASHFLEHLLFKGTKTRNAREIAEAFDAVGGDLNAFTGKEHTTYYARVLDRDFEMAIEYMCDMLQHSVLKNDDFEAERQVILEEISMHEDSPDELVHDVLMQTMWPDASLGRPVLGTVESISGMERDQVRRFWKRHYVPGNFVVAAAGNLDHDEMAERVLSWLETGPDVPAGRGAVRRSRMAPLAAPGVVIKSRPTEQAHICMGTPGLARNDPRRFALGVVNDAIGGGMSSRLFQEIREKRGLCYSVYSYHSMFAETGALVVYAGTTPAKAGEVMKLVNKELEDVAEKGITDQELERAKEHMKGSMVLSLEDTAGRMSRLGKSELAHGEILTLDQALEKIDAVNADECRSIASTVLAGPRALAVIGPFEEDEITFG